MSVIMFNSILLVATALLNGLAIVTIFKSSYLMGKPCYFIILLQSTVDLICSLLAMPLFLVHLVLAIYGMVNCVVFVISMFALYFTLGVSNITLLALTWERYVAILHPLEYGSKVSKKKLMVRFWTCITLHRKLLIYLACRLPFEEIVSILHEITPLRHFCYRLVYVLLGSSTVS